MRTNRHYSDEENSFIRANYPAMDPGGIAHHLSRSKKSISSQIQRLGIIKRGLRRWTTEEDTFLRDHQQEPLVWVAEQLERHTSVVSERAKVLGLFRRAKWGTHSAGYRTLRTQVDGQRRTVWEHIQVMEQRLGRSLCKPELVHHINGTKTDNRIDNLYLCRDKQHHQLVHSSLADLLPRLFDLGIVEFDHERGIYRLCETHN